MPDRVRDAGKSSLRRRPKQDRSRERVDDILNVAMRLIGEKGLDAVTMKEVAKLSGGPIASVYQYFPNKAAILATLYDRYNETGAPLLEDCLADVTTLDALCAGIDRMMSHYTDMMRNEPLFVDLMNAVNADKPLIRYDMEQTGWMTDTFFGRTRHLFPEAVWPQYRRLTFLLFHMGCEVTCVALAASDLWDERLILEFTEMIKLRMRSLCKTDG